MDPLSQIFGALADPTRRALLARLEAGEASVAELAQPFDMTPRAIAKHVAVLEAAGLVTRRREATARPAALSVEPLLAAHDWLGHYRALWEGRFERLQKKVENDD